MKILKYFAIPALLTLSFYTQAEIIGNESSMYVSIDVGTAETKDSFWKDNGFSGKGDDTGYKAAFGYVFGDSTFAMEGYYANFGEPVVAESGGSTATTEISGFGFDLIARSQGDFQIFGSLGLFLFDLDQKADGISFYDDNGLGYKLGIGASYRFTELFGMRASYDYYAIEDEFDDSYDVGMLSLGAMFHF